MHDTEGGNENDPAENRAHLGGGGKWVSATQTCCRRTGRDSPTRHRPIRTWESVQIHPVESTERVERETLIRPLKLVDAPPPATRPLPIVLSSYRPIVVSTALR
jgi:hypothetical protein